MDVLELPRPVINFLRTMAKESCRYALSWDIFGGPDSVTLTLTWKLIDEETQSSIINETSSTSKSQPSNYEINPSRSSNKPNQPASSSSPRRSRRDESTYQNENASVPAIFRSSRGKSLEGSNKHLAYQPLSSLERPTVANHYHHRSKKGQQQQQQKPISTQSDQIYGNLYDTRSAASAVKCSTISSLSSSSPSPQPTNNPPLSIAHTRAKQQQQQSITPPTVRKPTRPLTNLSRTTTLPVSMPSNYTPLRRMNNLARHDDDDDDDDTVDPWVKRFDCSLEDHDEETLESSERKESLPISDNLDESGNTSSGKVKFKTKPDYF